MEINSTQPNSTLGNGTEASGAETETTEFLVFGEPQILDDEITEVIACLRSGWIGTGPRVAQFERDFAAYKGVASAAGVGSCSAALHLSLLAAGIRPGDEVITTPLTFCATVNSIIHAGGVPMLADVDPVSMNLDASSVADRVTDRTRAILPVHFAGRPCDMDGLMAVAAGHELRVVEDCAHALEAGYHGTAAGTLGDFGCFSFYATKSVTTGEGGMVLARRAQDLEKIKIKARQGVSLDAWQRSEDPAFEYGYAVEIGFKYNMTDLQAAIGIHQLRRVAANYERRRAIWSRYVEAFQDTPVGLPASPEPDTRHACHLFTLMIDERDAGITRDEFVRAARRLGVGVGIHYVSLPEHPVYQERFGWKPEEWPAAHRIGRQTVSLPLTAKLTDADVERVIRVVRTVLRRGVRVNAPAASDSAAAGSAGQAFLRG
jgi:dTDP-4-amino-4,6-dideoxygalactose transaminase